MKRALLYIILVGIVSPVFGQDLETLINLGLENNPEIKKFTLKYEITAEKTLEVNNMPNTEFSYGYFVSEPETRTGAQKMKFSLKQMIPWFGTITARENYAGSLSDAQFEDIAIAKRKLIVAISNRYYSMYNLKSKVKILQENIRLLEVYETMALTSVSTGNASAVSVLRLQMRKNELQELEAVLEQKYLSQQSGLNSLLDRDHDVPIGVVTEMRLPEADLEPERSDLKMHPELLKYDKLYTSVEQSELLLQKDKSPLLGFGIDYIPVEKRPDMDFADNGKDIFMPMISLSIPIFNRKYRSASRQNELRQLEIDAEKQHKLNELERLTDEALYGLKAARISYGTHLKNLQQAKSAEKILIKNYESAILDFNDVLDIQELQLKFQMGLIEAVTDYYNNAAMINYLSQ